METIEKKTVEIEPALLREYEEKKYTIIHCRVRSGGGPVRIWKSTRLEDSLGGEAALLFPIGLSLYPNWSFIERPDGYSYFTLIFESLPKKKVPFVLIEDIPQPGGFYSPRLERRDSEVYHTELFCQ
jgi:hypothetical protein